MVIITQKFNGFGNQLLLTSHFLVNALEHDYELCISSFDRYVTLFEGTAGPQPYFFGPRPVRLYAGQTRLDGLFQALQSRWGRGALTRLPLLQDCLGVRVVSDLPFGDVDMNSRAYLTQACGSRPLLVHGWQYRDKRHFAKHADLLRQFFRPIKPHWEAVEEVLARNRQQSDVLIGVHLRRGDYAGWQGGAFFYDNATYARRMREMQLLFPAAGRVRFLLLSNEPIASADFADFNTGRSTNHPLEDLYVMAGCDYILGPPSSYSMWASFFGQVPLYHLSRPDQAVQSLNQFMVFEDQETAHWQSERVL